MNKLQQKQKGFTIIEVVLVLAIAGLIFMVVFLALPGLQRSQRDTQRKQDVGRFVAQLTTYQGNNKGALPCAVNPQTSTSSSADDVDNLLTGNATATPCLDSLVVSLNQGGSSFNDPSLGTAYSLTHIQSSNEADYNDNLGTIYYAINASCGNWSIGSGDSATSGTGINTGDTNPGSIAVATKLEDGMVYCQQD
jgi:prepilin-type N-terminal cleavage/methylation domain-containing protein